TAARTAPRGRPTRTAPSGCGRRRGRPVPADRDIGLGTARPAGTGPLVGSPQTPHRVDDPPPLRHLDQFQQIDVAVTQAGGAGDAAAEVVDGDLDPAVGRILTDAHAVPRGSDHVVLRERLERVRVIALDAAAALDQLGFN